MNPPEKFKFDSKLSWLSMKLKKRGKKRGRIKSYGFFNVILLVDLNFFK